MTFRAPAARCFPACSRAVKIPVDSTTISAPSRPQGSFAGSRSLSTVTRVSCPSGVVTTISFPSARTVPGRAPDTESCFSRWARVPGSVRSLTATISMSGSSWTARKMLRPILPNPLMPMRTMSPLGVVSQDGRDHREGRSKGQRIRTLVHI